MIETYSAAGKRHTAAKQQNQDALAWREKGPRGAIVLADGVSGCRYGGDGARCGAEAAADLLMQKGRLFLACPDRQAAELIAAHVAYEQGRLARQQGRPAEEYACTLAAALYDRRAEKLLYCSLGDSLILTVSGGRCEILSPPADSTGGCCVTQTMHAERAMRTGVISARGLEAVYILSDGAWQSLFAGGKLKADARTMFANRWYGDLQEYLREQGCEDDHSFISIDFVNAARRNAA